MEGDHHKGKLGCKSSRRPELGASGRTGTGERATMRAAASSEHCSVETLHLHKKPVAGKGGDDPLISRGSPWDWGRIGYCTQSSSRRRGGGTHGRSTAVKQGRSRRQPVSGRRAKTFCITSDPGKSGGVAETGGSGRISVEGRDNRTLSEQRTRGSRWSRNRPEAGLVDIASRM